MVWLASALWAGLGCWTNLLGVDPRYTVLGQKWSQTSRSGRLEMLKSVCFVVGQVYADADRKDTWISKRCANASATKTVLAERALVAEGPRAPLLLNVRHMFPTVKLWRDPQDDLPTKHGAGDSRSSQVLPGRSDMQRQRHCRKKLIQSRENKDNDAGEKFEVVMC